MTRKIFAALILAVMLTGTSACYRIMGSYLELTPPEHRVKATANIMVPMRDGVRLATDVYEPADRVGPLPVVMTRLPYNKDYIRSVGELMAQRGYVFVAQDCRATFHSEGDVFVPMVYEREDGMDTVKWMADQEWFNGSLGTWGPSYLGLTQWAVAADNPYLKAMYPQITTASLSNAIFLGGAFSYRLSTGWSAGVGKQNDKALPIPSGKLDLANEGFFNAPLQPDLNLKWEELSGLSIAQLNAKMAEAMGIGQGQVPPDFVQKMIGYMNYPAFAEYADAFNFHDQYNKVGAPALMISGWYDIFVEGQLHDFSRMRQSAPGDAGKYTRIIIGPWGHVSGVRKDAVQGAKLSTMIKDLLVLKWYDRWLKGIDNGIEKEAPVKLYVMGKNVWRDENEWPLARTQYVKWFLHSQGRANSVTGNGSLSTREPAAEQSDRFTYDPKNPVLTAGGNNLLEDVGARDQKDVEKRDDVLIFTSAPMTQDYEATGPVTAVIYAASSAVDTDFTVKLCDVFPDGMSLNLTEGIIRARYRDSITEPSLLEPGMVYEYRIKLWPTSNCFRKGHRIRIQVASSSFPRFDRNANAGGEGGAMNVIVAEQTIYHDARHPSYILLPEIP
ncbi:MAG TPA: CocE/NonD family hydrolase [bacterium]|nr:CocE/NonD family hydrolase [bacterium]